ncbi:uncharacterized protein LOC107468187 [Arachis duranensis]|uniref:Uncharacterized protein LOC107468187 n=1 Tax=Arachis duranensis TaxID=130453 RepID=A0A6P4C4C2_ARADU|nr:uncharacterized protein LOC107468187 [Arachis duranensis]
MELLWSVMMKQVIEKFSNFWFAQSFSECVRNCMTSKYEIDGRTATVYVILGCVSLWIWYIIKRKRRPIGPRPRPRPTNDDDVRSYLAADIVHSGALARQRLEDFKAAKANPETLDKAEKLLETLLEREHPDLVMLQKTVAKLEMSGREDSAVEILTRAIKGANDVNKSHEAYEFEMLLVEMLIYKGKFEEALKCTCLEDEFLKDARRPLYKAMIQEMLGKRDDALASWDQYVQVIDPHVHFDLLYVPRFLEASPSQDFDDFQQKVKRLHQAIIKSHHYPK